MATKKNKKMKADEPVEETVEAPVEEAPKKTKKSGPSSKAVAMVADVYPSVTGFEPSEEMLTHWATVVDDKGLNRPGLEVLIKSTRKAL